MFFNEAKLQGEVCITRNHTIGIMATIKSMIKIPSLAITMVESIF